LLASQREHGPSGVYSNDGVARYTQVSGVTSGPTPEVEDWQPAQSGPAQRPSPVAVRGLPVAGVVVSLALVNFDGPLVDHPMMTRSGLRFRRRVL
jgi:hypothetical protein